MPVIVTPIEPKSEGRREFSAETFEAFRDPMRVDKGLLRGLAFGA
jgi:hypothetical protein